MGLSGPASNNAALDLVRPPGAGTLVGVAGTTTTVQALALALERYDPEAIHRTEAEPQPVG